MATAKLLLDKSSTNKNGEHPIRIQVYHVGKQDKYATKLFATHNLFNEAHQPGAKTKAAITLKKKLDEAFNKA
ncbi:MAG: hypothetical protein JWP88_2248, partial [Flaviaesturariibacter sp.]|nr:hypothetical protein [Flaviaesturariibacter sp.]